MTGALTSHYANALADAVFKPNSGLSPKDAVEQLRAADALVSGSKELERALLSPAVSRNRKNAVIAKLADDLGLHRIIRNFLLVVVGHRRIHQFAQMQRDFELVVDERLGWIPAEIASAHELNAQQREQIERALGAKLGRFIRAHYSVDPSLIAGVRARVASKEYNATLRSKVEDMRYRLAGAH